jgi:hypothetical protein
VSRLPELKLDGHFTYQVWTPDQHLRAWGRFHNAIIVYGINALLEAYFRAGSQPAGFYVGVIDNTDYSSLGTTDTMASHSGWTELTSDPAAVVPRRRRQWLTVSQQLQRVYADGRQDRQGTVSVHRQHQGRHRWYPVGPRRI